MKFQISPFGDPTGFLQLVTIAVRIWDAKNCLEGRQSKEQPKFFEFSIADTVAHFAAAGNLLRRFGQLIEMGELKPNCFAAIILFVQWGPMLQAPLPLRTIARYSLRQHLGDFINAYNFGRRLKTLTGLTPYEFICRCWTNQPERFTLNPIHQMPGLNT